MSAQRSFVKGPRVNVEIFPFHRVSDVLLNILFLNVICGYYSKQLDQKEIEDRKKEK